MPETKSFEQAESQREYLTHQELQPNTQSCKYEVLNEPLFFCIIRS
jgi:hypothetical protein